MWEKAVVVWVVARPGSETCKTNPILKRSFKFAVSSVKSEKSGIPCSGFKLPTSNSPPNTSVGRVACKTNPIWSGRGRCQRRNARNEPNLWAGGRQLRIEIPDRGSGMT